MLENEILKVKLKKQLDSLNLDAKKKDKLVAELNYFSNIIVDLYLMKKHYNQREKTQNKDGI